MTAISESVITSMVAYCRPKWLLQYYYYCQKHYCNTITIAGSYSNTIAITFANSICFKKTKYFQKALVSMTSIWKPHYCY